MKKKRILFISSLIAEGIVLALLPLLAVFAKLNLLVTIFGCIADAGLITLSVWLYVKALKKYKESLLESKNELTGDPLIDLYVILGIPVQYNKDGSIKSIYELLQIMPIYDETGTRLLTPYELLGLMPKFDKNGVEIPTVFVIKNRVGKIAKVDLSQRVLTRKLTEQEMEEKLIQEALRRRLEEAKRAGDTKSVEIIKTAINKENKAKKKNAAPPKYIYGGKPEKIKIPDTSKATIDFFKPKDKKGEKPAAPAPKPPEPPKPPKPQMPLPQPRTDEKIHYGQMTLGRDLGSNSRTNYINVQGADEEKSHGAFSLEK